MYLSYLVGLAYERFRVQEEEPKRNIRRLERIVV
jgi:hypothetical protein